jgi:hypothetical protein
MPRPRPSAATSPRSLAVALALAVGLTAPACADAGAPDAVDVASDVRPAVDLDAPDATPDALAVASLTAVSPPEGPTSGLTAVTVSGAGLASARAVRFGATPALDLFAVSDRELVMLTPPLPAGWVDVTVELADGATVSRPQAFLYRDPVGLSAVEPSAGSTLGGTPLTLHGAGFTPGLAVLVGGRRALDVVVADPGTLTCTSPEGLPGPVDVIVSGEAGSARLASAFTYEADLAPGATGVFIDRVTPASGPVAGGTTVTVEGRGLRSGLGVRLGAASGRAVRVEPDGRRLSFVTPPGSPGPASLHLLDGPRRASAHDVFTYVASSPRLLAASPSRGAVSGGTRVELLGEGLPTDGLRAVTFGGRDARLLEPLAGHRVVVAAPPGPLGAADVVLTYDRVTLTLPHGYTWFDPATAAGTSGEPLSGALNVTVIETRSGARVPGALAFVEGGNLVSSRSCLTDGLGQCVVSAAGLVGPLRVTVSAGGYQTVAFAGLAVENVTIPILRAFTCEDLADYPCDQLGGGPTSVVRVEVDGLDKGPSAAFGRCADWRDVAAHCTACDAVGAGCADGANCLSLGDEASAHCATPCAAEADCEAGFRCLDPSGGTSPRCVPPPPERVAWCNLSEVDPTDPKGLVWPGAEVDADGRVTLDGRLGDFAVVCFGGNDVRGDFTADVLGIRRGLSASRDSEVVEAAVTLDVPLDARASVRLDLPSLVRSGDLLASDRASFDAFLMLGGDGGVPFRTLVSTRAGPWEVAVPSRLTGPLADATWAIRGAVDSPSRRGGAVILEDNLADLRAPWERRAGLDGAWVMTPAALPPVAAAAPWGDELGALVVVGDAGLILRRAGRSWGRMGAGTVADLRAVATMTTAEGAVRALAGGVGGVVTRWDGLRWQLLESGTRDDLRGLAFLPGGAVERAVAVAGRAVLGWDGARWRRLWEAPAELRGLAVGAGEVWVVGDGGLAAMARVPEAGDALAFAVVPTGVRADLAGVALTPDGAVDVVGAGGVWLVGGEAGLRALATPTAGGGLPEDASRLGRDLTVVTATAAVLPGFPADAVAGGVDGALWHRVGDRVTAAVPGRHGAVARGTVRALVVPTGGAELLALGGHDRVLGPFVGIPDDLDPRDGGALGRTLSWTGGGLPPHYNLVEVRGAIGPCVVCGLQVLIPWVPWLAVTRGDVTRADFHPVVADFGLGFGRHEARITRVRTEPDFDFDATAARGLFGGRQRASAWRETAFSY